MIESGVIEMEWGHVSDDKKAHCFNEVDKTGICRSLCKKVVSFTVRPVEETLEEHVWICFKCLLLYINKGGDKT